MLFGEGSVFFQDTNAGAANQGQVWQYVSPPGLNNPAFQSPPGRYAVRTVSLEAERPATSISGLRVLSDLTLDSLQPSDSALILPGGDAWDEGGNVEAVECARRFLKAGVPVAAICGATAGLARGGLLDRRRHTSNAPEYLAATGYAGGALYETSPAVTDGDLITASATAPVDFAYHIFKRLDAYKEATLEAWYGLFKTGDPKYYARC